MLYRPGLLTYDNYGLEGYRTWPRNVITRTANPVYDEFGDFLVNGVEVYHLRENRRFDDPAQVFSGSIIAKPNNYEGFLNRLMVADDSYNSWQTRLIIGDRIRTHFSPLILDLAALNGIRWDLANERHNFSVLASRMDKPVLSQEDATALSTVAFASYLLGGHWQWRWRTIDLSTSYVNLFRIDTRSPPDWNGMKGQLPNRVQVIDYLVVRIEDTSPLDGNGPGSSTSISCSTASGETISNLLSRGTTPRILIRAFPTRTSSSNGRFRPMWKCCKATAWAPIRCRPPNPVVFSAPMARTMYCSGSRYPRMRKWCRPPSRRY